MIRRNLKMVFWSWPETRCIARHLGALTLFLFPSLDYLMEYVHFEHFAKLFEREISRGKVFFFLYSRCRRLDNCLVDVLPRNQLFLLLLLLVLYANEASQTARERESVSTRDRVRLVAVGLERPLRCSFFFFLFFLNIIYLFIFFIFYYYSLFAIYTHEKIFSKTFFFVFL